MRSIAGWTALVMAGTCSSGLVVAEPYNPSYRSAYDTPYRSTYDMGEPQRAGRWEVALQARYQDYDTLRFKSNVTLDPDASWAAGFSFGYNLDQYLNLSFEIFGNEADYNGVVELDPATTAGVEGSLDSSSGQFNVTYHWFDSAVTPFLSAGLGWTYIDSRIIKSFEGYECWYRPWYGYVCGDTYNTYDDTVFSYNAAIGLRWDIDEQFFLRGSVGRQWVYMDETSTHPSIDFGRIELGMMF